MAYNDMVHRFGFHPATTDEKRNEHSSVRHHCLELAHLLDDNLPDERKMAFNETRPYQHGGRTL